MKLRQVPTEDVTVTLSSNNDDVTIADTDPNTPDSQNTLMFTPQNWDDAQMLTLAAAEDEDGEEDSATIALSCSRRRL